MREAADHSCSESHQAENVSLKPYTRRWTNPVLNSALFGLGVHTAGVIVWSELKADNTLTLFVVYKFWAFLLNKQTNKINHCDYFHLLHLKDWSASKICLLRETIFRLWNSASDVSNYGSESWQNMSSNSSVEVSQPSPWIFSLNVIGMLLSWFQHHLATG